MDVNFKILWGDLVVRTIHKESDQFLHLNRYSPIIQKKRSLNSLSQEQKVSDPQQTVSGASKIFGHRS